jgi:hypothetical protein
MTWKVRLAWVIPAVVLAAAVSENKFAPCHPCAFRYTESAGMRGSTRRSPVAGGSRKSVGPYDPGPALYLTATRPHEIIGLSVNKIRLHAVWFVGPSRKPYIHRRFTLASAL